MSVRSRARRACGAALAAALLLAGLTACGNSKDNATDAAGPVTITVNGLPPATDKVNRQNYLDDVAAFTKKYPNIKRNPKEGVMDPATFAARLAGGQVEDALPRPEFQAVPGLPAPEPVQPAGQDGVGQVVAARDLVEHRRDLVRLLLERRARHRTAFCRSGAG